MPTTIITGVTGQDGAYLARNLLSRGHRVVGTYRSGSGNSWRLDELGLAGHPDLILAELNLLDLGSCIRLLEKTEPDFFYNFAAQSFVGASFEQPVTTAQVTAVGALHCLEAIRCVNKGIRFYQASSSELFGRAAKAPQNEDTPFHPRSPYAIAKLFAHWTTLNYRDAHDMFAVAGILFNHESPLRGREFVTRKISRSVAAMARGGGEVLELGNIDVERDWGYSEEYVEGIRRMVEDVSEPDTFVFATGRTNSVRRFTELAFEAAGIPIAWKGKGLDEQGVDAATGRVRVKINPEFFRPAEVETLTGDASKALRCLNWKAETLLPSLVKMMVDADLRRDHSAAQR